MHCDAACLEWRTRWWHPRARSQATRAAGTAALHAHRATSVLLCRCRAAARATCCWTSPTSRGTRYLTTSPTWPPTAPAWAWTSLRWGVCSTGWVGWGVGAAQCGAGGRQQRRWRKGGTMFVHTHDCMAAGDGCLNAHVLTPSPLPNPSFRTPSRWCPPSTTCAAECRRACWERRA